MIWLTLLGVLLVLGYFFLSGRDGATEAAPMRDDFIPTVSLEEARAGVRELLAAGIYVSDPPALNVEALKQLGPITREFFMTYGKIWSEGGGLELAATAVASSEHRPGHLSIGHSEDWDIVQRPGQDEVFIVEGSEGLASAPEICFSSVYHLLVEEAGKDSASRWAHAGR
ncbi:MAG: hypothetical protein AB7E83_24420 [Ramlibacter sp.]